MSYHQPTVFNDQTYTKAKATREIFYVANRKIKKVPISSYKLDCSLEG